MEIDAMEKELLERKNQALLATQKADGAFYEGYLAENAIAITPHGVFDKPAIVQQMSRPDSSFKSLKVEDERAIVLTPDSGVVTYKAIYPDYSVYVTTVYERIEGEWKGVIYQQTRLG